MEGKIKNFRIKQGFFKYGDEIYRRQQINIGFFDQNMAFQEHEKILIEDKEVTEVPQFEGLTVPHAILMNSSDYGFGVFVIDEKSIKVYEQHLDKVPDQLNKAVVIGQFIVMMREILYPATSFPRILTQMYDEKNQNLINTVFTALWAAKTTFLPADKVP